VQKGRGAPQTGLLFSYINKESCVMTKSERKQATWIWYPGDFEVWLHREVSIRREERGSIYAPFYRLDSPYASLKFQ
jgi:hypothetical protein